MRVVIGLLCIAGGVRGLTLCGLPHSRDVLDLYVPAAGAGLLVAGVSLVLVSGDLGGRLGYLVGFCVSTLGLAVVVSGCVRFFEEVARMPREDTSEGIGYLALLAIALLAIFGGMSGAALFEATGTRDHLMRLGSWVSSVRAGATRRLRVVKVVLRCAIGVLCVAAGAGVLAARGLPHSRDVVDLFVPLAVFTLLVTGASLLIRADDAAERLAVGLWGGGISGLGLAVTVSGALQGLDAEGFGAAVEVVVCGVAALFAGVIYGFSVVGAMGFGLDAPHTPTTTSASPRSSRSSSSALASSAPMASSEFVWDVSDLTEDREAAGGGCGGCGGSCGGD